MLLIDEIKKHNIGKVKNNEGNEGFIYSTADKIESSTNTRNSTNNRLINENINLDKDIEYIKDNYSEINNEKLILIID